MTRRSRYLPAFTLVELNLAILFVGLLVLAVAMTTISVSRTYQYGAALKYINQIGREVTDQIRRDISSASSQRVEYHEVGGVGRLCLGTVSYVYNSAGLLNSGGSSLVHDTTAPSTPRPINLARIDDRDSSWCQQSSGIFTKNDITAADSYTELLRDDSITVAVHSLRVNKLISSGGSLLSESLVEVVLNIGTNEIQTTDGGECKPPTNPQENFNNCAVRQFVTVVRVAGGQP